MEKKCGFYQRELLHTILNHELPEDASELVYKIVIRLLEDKAAGDEHVSLTEQTRRYLHEAINELEESKIVKVYRLIRGMFGGAA